MAPGRAPEANWARRASTSEISWSMHASTRSEQVFCFFDTRSASSSAAESSSEAPELIARSLFVSLQLCDACGYVGIVSGGLIRRLDIEALRYEGAGRRVASFEVGVPRASPRAVPLSAFAATPITRHRTVAASIAWCSAHYVGAAAQPAIAVGAPN
jgi:hypothetical protein